MTQIQINLINKKLDDVVLRVHSSKTTINVYVCVFTFMHLEGFICLGLEFQGIYQRCCVEDISFLCQDLSSPL